jgi:NTP pyrophosphatase (non-canonical NTP hydrolase)
VKRALIAEFDAHVHARMNKNGTPMPLALICLGISGESGEVLEIIEEVLPLIDHDEVKLLQEARTNLELELGNTLWYVVGAMQTLGTNFSDEMERVGHLEPGPRRPLAVLVGAFCDMVKKQEWHGKTFPSLALRDALIAVFVELGMLAWDNRLYMDTVMQANIDKLNKRYPLDKGGFVEGGGVR